MLASLRHEYGIDLRTYRGSLPDLADLTFWLPRGCPFWISYGGPRSLTVEAVHLAAVAFRLELLYWQGTEKGSKGQNQPEPPAMPAYAHDVVKDEARVESRAEAHLRRTRGTVT